MMISAGTENEARNRRKKNFRRYKTYNLVTSALVTIAALLVLDRYGWAAWLVVMIPGLFLADWAGAVIFKQEYRPWNWKPGSRDRGF